MQPIYEQIVDQVKSAIMCGELKEEQALPSVRTLAKELKVSALTVKKAYDALEAEGFKNYDFEYKASTEKEGGGIDQSEDPGTEVDVATKIIIYLSDGSLKEKSVEILLPTAADLQQLGILPSDYVEGHAFTYRLTLYQNGKVIYDVPTVVLGDKTYATIKLIDSGIQSYELRINDISWNYLDVDFTK